MISPVAATISRTHVVATVGDEHVAHGVDGNAEGAALLGGGRGPVVAAVSGLAGTGDGDDVAVRLATSRIALLSASPMNRSPAESTATVLGPFSSAAVAGPPSPL